MGVCGSSPAVPVRRATRTRTTRTTREGIVASNCHVEFPRAIERATAMGTRDEAMGTVIGA